MSGHIWDSGGRCMACPTIHPGPAVAIGICPACRCGLGGPCPSHDGPAGALPWSVAA